MPLLVIDDRKKNGARRARAIQKLRDRPVRRGLVVVVNPAVVVAVPVPVGALAVLRSLVELVFREIGAIAAEVGIVLQGGPGHWIKVLAHSHETAEAENGIRNLAAELVYHYPFELTDLLLVRSVNGRPFHLIAGDQGDGFLRF